MDTFRSLNLFFEKELEDLETTTPETRSYIIGAFSKFKSTHYDLSQESITIQFSIAKFNNDFNRFQNLGDWLFVSFSLFPEHLNNASPDYYCSVAQISYLNCYKQIRAWRCFEELADQFKSLTEQAQKLIIK